VGTLVECGVGLCVMMNNQEAVSCFQELGAERLDGCVSVIVNHVVEKCRESRQLAGTLLLELITEDLLTVNQFVNGSAPRLLLSSEMILSLLMTRIDITSSVQKTENRFGFAF